MPIIDPSQALKNYGKKILDNGYQLIPIKPDSKAPALNAWAKHETTAKEIKAWSLNGKGDCGIGILNANNPMVDIDVLDEDVVSALMDMIEEEIGYNMVRVGRSPKMGLIYRTDDSFRKVTSQIYIDDDGEENRVEILGTGQQCVVIGNHPDTGDPYRFATRKTIVNTPSKDLIPLNEEQAYQIIEMFADCVPPSWTVKSGRSTRQTQQDDDDDEEFSNEGLEAYKPICDLTDAQVQEYLENINPDGEGYDSWNRVGFALWHQYSGGEKGFLFWHEWSKQGAAYERTSEKQMRRKWKTYDWTKNAKGQGTITFATVIRQVDFGEIDGVADTVLDAYQERFVYHINGRIIDLNMHISAQKDAQHGISVPSLRILNPTDVYTPTGSKKTKHLIDKWLGSPKKKVVVGFNYSIGDDLVFELENAQWLNGYVPPAFAETEKETMLGIFHDHMNFLFPNDKDRALMYEWIAHRVQKPADRIKFVPLHLTLEHGTGRGWLADVITEMVGPSNLQTAKMKELCGEDGGQFNTFLDSAVCVLHEVREAGKRFEVSDRVRDTLDGDYLKVIYKGKTGTMKKISCSFLMFSNHFDALALDAHDRRMWVIKGPDHIKSRKYYNKLYYSIDKENPKRQQFLMQLYNYLGRYDLSNFSRGRVAPDYSGMRQKLIANATNGNDVAMQAYMQDKPFEAATTKQIVQWANLSFPDEVIEPQAIAKILGNSRMFQCKRMRIGDNSNARPWIFDPNGVTNNIALRKSVMHNEEILLRMSVDDFSDFDVDIEDLI